MGLFKRASPGGGEPPAYPVYAKYAWNDRETDQLAATTRDTTRPLTDRLAQALDRMANTRDDPERMYLAFSLAVELGDSTPEPLNELRTLLAARCCEPTDAADRADALAVLANATLQAGWKLRGRGLASTVGQDAWPIFHAMAEDADEIARQALELVPDHPCAAVSRMWSGIALGLEHTEWGFRFDVARRRCPTLWEAHRAMLQASCQKWYGSHTTMFDYARDVLATTPAGHPLTAILPYAHLEHWVDADVPRDQSLHAMQADRSLVNDASDAWLASRDGQAHPQSITAHQLYGWYFVIVADSVRANPHLSQTGGRIASMPWDYYDDEANVYRRFLKAADVPLPKPT